MDLEQFDPDKKSARPLHLKGPNGKLLFDETSKEPVLIFLESLDTKAARAKQHDISSRSASEMVGTRRNKSAIDTAKLEAETIMLLASVTHDWKHIVVSGKALPCVEEAVVDLYTRFPFVREQVETFVNDRSNFLGN